MVNNRVGEKSEYQPVSMVCCVPQLVEPQQLNWDEGWQSASGAQIWTKFDPEGLRDETEDEEKKVAKMVALEVAAHKTGKKDDVAFAKNLGQSVKDYQKMISNVPDGAKDPVRLQTINKALSVWMSPSASASYAQKTTFNDKSINYCNVFVADSFSAAGFPLVGSSNWRKDYAPTANQFADPKTVIKDTIVDGQVKYHGKDGSYTQTSGQPAKPGDIVAFPAQNAEGHVGISLGNDVYISATSSEAYKGDKQKNVVIKSDLAERDMTIREPDAPSKSP